LLYNEIAFFTDLKGVRVSLSKQSASVGTRALLPRFMPLLRVTISVVLLAALLSHIDFTHVVEVVSHARADLLVLAVLLTAASVALSAYRWHMLLHEKIATVRYRNVLRIILVSGFLGAFTPGSVGAEILRIYGLTRRTGDLAHAFTSVLVERFIALVALALLVLLGLTASPPGIPEQVADMAWVGVAGLVAGYAALMHSRSRAVIDLILGAAWLAPIRSRLRKLYACLDSYKRQPTLMLLAMAVGIGFQLTRVAIVAVGGWALGQHVTLTHYIIIVPITMFVSLLPISIAGLGVREAAYVYLFGLVGVAPETAFALSLLVFIIGILLTLPGAWLYAKGK
jgi:uncharacterized protein (TIRG00374 family)